jgi:hypothetical protein
MRSAAPIAVGSIAAAIALAAAGQAVGPVLSSPTAGEIAATVSQAITIDTENLDLSERVSVWGDVDRWVATTDDEGTHFTVAYENNVGDIAQVNLFLLNRSRQDVAAQLLLDVPAGVDVHVTGSAGGKAPSFHKAQMGANTWLMTVDAHAAGADTGPSGTGNRLSIRLRVQDDAHPGFYRIHGTLRQFEG